MATEAFEVSCVLPTPPEKLYAAWLSSKQHSAFTGGEAHIEPRVGGAYSAWDGYIEGQTLELEPSRRIVQSWRSQEFADEAPDSRLELLFAPAEGGTRLTVKHSDVPEGEGEKYRLGWQEHYFEPMQKYYAAPASDEPKPAPVAEKKAKAPEPALVVTKEKPALAKAPKPPPAKETKAPAKVAPKPLAKKAPVKPAPKSAKPAPAKKKGR